MDLGEELNALYTDVLHNRCIFTVKLSKLICHAPKLGIIFDTHYKGIWQPPLKSRNLKIQLHSVLSWPKIRVEPKFHEDVTYDG